MTSDAAATVRSGIVDGIAMVGIHPGPQFDAMIDSIMRTMFARCVRWSVRELAEEMDAAEGEASDLASLTTPRPLDEWDESDGAVLWWRFPIEEPPYAGTLLDDDFPHYVTHWTPIPVPRGGDHA